MPRKVTGYMSASGKMFDSMEEAEKDELLFYAQRLEAALDLTGATYWLTGDLITALQCDVEAVLAILRAGGHQVYVRTTKEEAA